MSEIKPAHPLFEKAVTIVAYLYLLRVPLLIGAFLVLLPFAALLQNSPLVSLLQNLFWLTPVNTFWCTVAALVLSWSLLLTARLVLLNGEERFGVRQVVSMAQVTGRAVFVVVLIALPLLIGPFTQYKDFAYKAPEMVKRAVAILGGGLAAYVLAYIALIAAVLLAPRGTQDAARAFPAPEFMSNWLRWADKHYILPEGFAKITCWVRDNLAPGFWAGYLNPQNGLPWAGHWLAIMFFLATFGLSLVIDLYTRAYLGKAAPVPALAFVLLILLNLNWFLSILAFFLDRYRIPLIIPLLVFCIVGGQFVSSDHYYKVEDGVSNNPVSPKQVLSSRIQQNKPIVLIATAGGGIQAAAWTAQVMAGLEDQIGSRGTVSFAKSVALISAVSGGAVGSMYYLKLFHPDKRDVFDRESLKGITEKASASSLDEIAWALLYRDFRRIFLPYLDLSPEKKLIDRGYMLEESWRNRGNIQENLSNWRRGVAEGIRPAAIFNATIAETGEPILLTTSEMSIGSNTLRRRNFYELYPNTDLPVVTAVRLASTFPYVTPAARKPSSQPAYHLVDGGYYDNYGISSLVAWLDEAFVGLQGEKKPLPPILIIQIRSFPDDAGAKPTNTGWFFQSYAPLNALLSVRTTGQLVRDREELALFVEKWANRSSIHVASFEFKGHNAPLSWSMNPAQQAEISKKWVELAHDSNPELCVVQRFLNPNYSGCREAKAK